MWRIKNLEETVIIIDLIENNKVVRTKVMKLNGECGSSKEFDLNKYEKK